jgi:hypothetical protein
MFYDILPYLNHNSNKKLENKKVENVQKISLM